MRCHATCERYLKWKRAREEARTADLYLSTIAHQKKTENVLRMAVKHRADGRGKNRGE
jgi:hypothetical protein